MEKLIKVGNKEVAFKATASTAIRYLSFYGTDFLRDLQKVKKDDKSVENIMPVTKLAYIMAKQSNPDLSESLLDWMDEFETADMLAASPDIINLWYESAKTNSQLKKNLAQLTEK